jgi:hypothetical protein
LERLYTFDLALMGDLDGMQAQMEEMAQNTSPEVLRQKMQQSDNLLRALEKKFRERNDFLTRPK